MLAPALYDGDWCGMLLFALFVRKDAAVDGVADWLRCPYEAPPKDEAGFRYVPSVALL